MLEQESLGRAVFLICGEGFSLKNRGGANPDPQLLQWILLETRTRPLMVLWPSHSCDKVALMLALSPTSIGFLLTKLLYAVNG